MSAAPPGAAVPNVVRVIWRDPADGGREKVEEVRDEADVARRGVVATRVGGLGAASAQEARDVGLFALRLKRDRAEARSRAAR